MRYMEMRMATVTKTLALKMGQVKYVPEKSTPTARLGSHMILNLLEDSPMERMKKRVQMIPLHSIFSEKKNQIFTLILYSSYDQWQPA